MSLREENDQRGGCKKWSTKPVVWLCDVCHRILWFYEAPVVRFYYHAVSLFLLDYTFLFSQLDTGILFCIQTFFLIFLALFSYVLLVDYFPLNIYGETRSGYQNLLIPISEIILHIFIWSMIVDALHQVSLLSHRNRYFYITFFVIFHISIYYQLILRAQWHYGYIAGGWNWEDLAGIICYLVGFITRFFVIESVFAASKYDVTSCLFSDALYWLTFNYRLLQLELRKKSARKIRKEDSLRLI